MFLIRKSFANFTGKHLCWSLFVKNLQAEGLQLYLKKDSNTGFSREIREIFKKPFLQNTSGECFCTSVACFCIF